MAPMMGVAASRRSIDWAKVGREHARAAWQRAVSAPEAATVGPLGLVTVEPDPGALQSVYGLVSDACWSEYRDAYRSELHARNLAHEATLGRARKRAAAAGGL